MTRIPLGECVLEFSKGGRTIWVNGLQGAILRIKTTGVLKVDSGCQNLCAHCDIVTDNDIEICVPSQQMEGSNLSTDDHEPLD